MQTTTLSTAQNPKIESLSYNAASGQFDGLLRNADGSSLAVSVNAPITAEFHEVTRLVMEKAKKAQKSGTFDSQRRHSNVKAIDSTPIGQAAAKMTSSLFSRLIRQPLAA